MSKMATDTPFLSVAMTAFNEERRIVPSLERIVAYLDGRGFPYEIVVNDDGSRDETARIVREFPCPHVRLLVAPVNQGKGGGIRRAVLACRGQFVLFTDADLSTPIEEVEKLLAKLEGPFDIAIGSRIQFDGRDMRATQLFYRRMLGKFFHAVAWVLVVRGVRDTQAGFKCFRYAAAQRLFSLAILDSIMFDVEIIYLAQRLGYRIAEVPVEWVNVAGSRMRFSLGHALTVLRDLLRIKRLHRHLAPLEARQST